MFGIEKEIVNTKNQVELLAKIKAFNWVIKVILSCKKIEHLQGAANLVMNYEAIYGTSAVIIDLYDRKYNIIIKQQS